MKLYCSEHFKALTEPVQNFRVTLSSAGAKL